MTEKQAKHKPWLKFTIMSKEIDINFICTGVEISEQILYNYIVVFLLRESSLDAKSGAEGFSMRKSISKSPYAIGGYCCHGAYRFAFAHTSMSARIQTNTGKI